MDRLRGQAERMRHHLLIDIGRDDEMILTDLLGWRRGDLSPWSLTEGRTSRPCGSTAQARPLHDRPPIHAGKETRDARYADLWPLHRDPL
jgi:hypothetical protein